MATVRAASGRRFSTTSPQGRTILAARGRSAGRTAGGSSGR